MSRKAIWSLGNHHQQPSVNSSTGRGLKELPVARAADWSLALLFIRFFFFDFNEPATSLSSTDPTILLAMSSAMWSKHLSCWPWPSTSRNLSAIPCVAFEFLNGIRIKLRLNKRWENQNSKEGAFSMEWIYLSLIPSYNSTSVWCNCNPKQQKIGGDNIHTIKISKELMHWHMLQDLLFHLSGKPVRAVIECRRNSLLRRDTRSTSWPNMVMPTFLFQLIASRINKQSYGNSKYDSRYPRIQGIKITCLIQLLTSSIWPSTNYVWVRREHVINCIRKTRKLLNLDLTRLLPNKYE